MSLILSSASQLFGVATQLRRFYQTQVLRPVRFPVKIISVGNVTVGGTGKTPFVDFLCKKIKDKKIAVLSRGYKRSSRGFFKVDPKKGDAGSFYGDEPVMLSIKNPKVQFFVCEDRVEGIQKIMESWDEVDLVILDDALQNYRIEKDLEFVILDATEPFSHYKLLPQGRARVPLESLSPEQVLVFTKTDLSQDHSWIEKKFSDYPMLGFKYKEPQFSEEQLQNKEVYLLSGIGKPKNFEALISKKFVIKKHFIFRDHHVYTEKDLERVALEVGGAPVITTEKDFVKIAALKTQLNITSLSVEFEFSQNEYVFDEILKIRIFK